MNAPAQGLNADSLQSERLANPIGGAPCPICGEAHIEPDPDTIALRIFARDGNPYAIAPLVDKYEPWIRSEVTRRLKPGTPSDLTDDVCQFALMSVLLCAGKIDCKKNARGLIMAIVRNAVPEFFRRRGMSNKKRRVYFVDMSPAADDDDRRHAIQDILSIENEPDSGLVWSDNRHKARILLRELTSELREVFYMHTLGHTFDEIADLLGIATSTANTRYHEAVALLRHWADS